ncbi:hypothetical protein AMTRI_Chr06g169320 [Amborella trichopoda]
MRNEKGLARARAFPKSDVLQSCLFVVKNRQRFPRHLGQARVKKLVQENRIHLATWNVETPISNGVSRYHETKESKHKIDWYKRWYTGKDNNKNSVGIIVDKDLKDKVINVKRIGDRLLLI